MSSKIIRNICIGVICLLLFVYLTIVINSFMNGGKIGFFSTRFYIMTSDSIEANINKGDLVFAKSIKIENIKPDDDIIYKKEDNELIVKKVKSIEGSNITFYIQDEGLNKETNGSKEKTTQIIGKVTGKIKGIGNVALFIQSPLGTLNMIVVAGCVLIIIKKLNNNIKEEKSENNNAEKN